VVGDIKLIPAPVREASQLERDPVTRSKVEAFHAKAKARRLVRFYKSPDDLNCFDFGLNPRLDASASYKTSKNSIAYVNKSVYWKKK
jgi:hypothetical protein